MGVATRRKRKDLNEKESIDGRVPITTERGEGALGGEAPRVYIKGPTRGVTLAEKKGRDDWEDLLRAERQTSGCWGGGWISFGSKI